MYKMKTEGTLKILKFFRKVADIKVSISHEKNYAVAVVILSGEARS